MDSDRDDNDDDDNDDMDTEAEEGALESAPAPAHMAVKKRPQPLYQKLEYHCAMITEELGFLKSIVRRAHSAHQFALVAQNTTTSHPHALLMAAQKAQPAINASKARFVAVIKELERFAPIGQDLKTRLLEATIAYHSELVTMVSLTSLQFINHPREPEGNAAAARI
ncbi:hypothetical protein BGZ75_000556 [Mortierella antarctica]|nr:hypothetical protein BGZ75_000556 [Mortierella antarctica]